jgi:superfamily I DNA/RNA helicase
MQWPDTQLEPSARCLILLSWHCVRVHPGVPPASSNRACRRRRSRRLPARSGFTKSNMTAAATTPTATGFANRIERRDAVGLWAGTFHGVGARLLREYSDQIGLDKAFTIHDREDAADLMNLARHDLGFSKTEKRFPTKGTCLVASTPRSRLSRS